MAVKGTWTTETPPDHLPTILGLVALGVILWIGLANHADQDPRPAPTPSASASPAPSPSPTPRPTLRPAQIRGA
jgi:hypothetical protein